MADNNNDNLDRHARIQELQKKQQSGHPLTPEETDELGSLHNGGEVNHNGQGAGKVFNDGSNPIKKTS